MGRASLPTMGGRGPQGRSIAGPSAGRLGLGRRQKPARHPLLRTAVFRPGLLCWTQRPAQTLLSWKLPRPGSSSPLLPTLLGPDPPSHEFSSPGPPPRRRCPSSELLLHCLSPLPGWGLRRQDRGWLLLPVHSAGGPICRAGCSSHSCAPNKPAHTRRMTGMPWMDGGWKDDGWMMEVGGWMDDGRMTEG